ncbi:hypothetical protein PUNSTDRAFT_44735 [Punctularia strigosozonata HHB-11173 SS5]|uniref:uncharacterized protein n=1 Tax=Punctularia strigosozonata (strain HHB-11173) TaxID=741275 RepID=UPI00044171F2|nr:uncharacterized protein PUNSTDRAFT_44735 [Punctularia strigosozonata HHB-11173 SS5]EIN08132.1 hypothetical protein PUNSTDRAFT_44735 [Punctularia strigosozonata HHB-11173 SS5]
MAFGVAMDGAPLPPALVTFKNDLQMQNMFQTGLFSLLIYDHLLNFGEEVERIWKKPWTGASILFVLNRYLTPLEFIVVMTAFQSEWPAEMPTIREIRRCRFCYGYWDMSELQFSQKAFEYLQRGASMPMVLKEIPPVPSDYSSEYGDSSPCCQWLL